MSGVLITKMTLYGCTDVLCDSCMQRWRKAKQITSAQGANKERFINGFSCSCSCWLQGTEGSSPEPIFSGDWGPSIISVGLGSSPTEIFSATGIQWEPEGSRQVLLSHKAFWTPLTRQIQFNHLGKGALCSSFEGWGTGGGKKESFSVKKKCSGFEAFSKCNWTSAAPSVTAARDFTSRELNTFMQDPLPCT